MWQFLRFWVRLHKVLKVKTITKDMAESAVDNIEEKWKAFWEKEKIYHADLSRKKIYSIDTPPPTVSGEMHIGHAFSYSQQDFIARFYRMYLANEGSVFYPFGTDDNGLPTEKLIQRLKNVKSKDMSRAEFIDLCLKTLKEITPAFVQDWKNLGISCDYNMYYSTIDKNTQKVSQKYFIDLYKKGLIYRKEFPTIWDVQFQTPVAQAELEDKEKETFFTTLRFISGGKDLPIATTRPELLGSCVAVFVNPKDKRYKNFVGKKAIVPIFGHEVPILTDESANIEKGTGVLMICSYGDKYDVDAINRHNLKPKITIQKDGTLNIGDYKGMPIKKAREKILEDLKKNNLILDQKKINHVVNVYEKSGEEIEFLPTEQWFIQILENRKKLVEQGKKINWKPEYMFKRYENWINGLEWDWSISRERHFGIPIPVWYCEKCGQVILPEEKELPVDPVEKEKKCPKCKIKAVAENKVLDTWVTSSISPQIASIVSGNKVKVPFSLRPQAHDIIRTWAFYTIVRSYYHENSVPWKDIAISGNVSLKGEKMSKSKGNVIDPKKVISQYGADALRFWAAGSKLGEDLDYQEKDLVTGKKFITKLSNATKFVFMGLEGYDGKKPKKMVKTDELFLNKLNKLVSNCTDSFLNYEYSKAKGETEQFFWQMFCDNYLEIVKNRIYNGKGDEKISAQYTLYHSLLTILKLISPIMPFISEEVYQNYFRKNEKNKSIHISSWPKQEKFIGDIKFDALIEIISKVRQEKSRAQKSMKSEIILTIDKKSNELIGEMIDDLKAVTNSATIKTGEFSVEFV